MTQRQLKTKLKEFGINSSQIRIGYETGKMGYERADFVEVWKRYLSADTPKKSSTQLQPSNHAAYSDFESSTGCRAVEDKKTLEAPAGAACSGVEEKTPLSGEDEDGGVEDKAPLSAQDWEDF